MKTETELDKALVVARNLKDAGETPLDIARSLRYDLHFTPEFVARVLHDGLHISARRIALLPYRSDGLDLSPEETGWALCSGLNITPARVARAFLGGVLGAAKYNPSLIRKLMRRKHENRNRNENKVLYKGLANNTG